MPEARASRATMENCILESPKRESRKDCSERLELGDDGSERGLMRVKIGHILKRDCSAMRRGLPPRPVSCLLCRPRPTNANRLSSFVPS